MIDFAVKTLIRALDELGIAYMVVGSYSSNYWGPAVNQRSGRYH